MPRPSSFPFPLLQIAYDQLQDKPSSSLPGEFSTSSISALASHHNLKSWKTPLHALSSLPLWCWFFSAAARIMNRVNHQFHLVPRVGRKETRWWGSRCQKNHLSPSRCWAVPWNGGSEIFMLSFVVLRLLKIWLVDSFCNFFDLVTFDRFFNLLGSGCFERLVWFGFWKDKDYEISMFVRSMYDAYGDVQTWSLLCAIQDE